MGRAARFRGVDTNLDSQFRPERARLSASLETSNGRSQISALAAPEIKRVSRETRTLRQEESGSSTRGTRRWRAGKTITGSEARVIWEREKWAGAPRASTTYTEKRPEMSNYRHASSPRDGDDGPRRDDERCVLELEKKLFDALCELKALRPLRVQALELPELRGKLRRKTEQCATLCVNPRGARPVNGGSLSLSFSLP